MEASLARASQPVGQPSLACQAEHFGGARSRGYATPWKPGQWFGGERRLVVGVVFYWPVPGRQQPYVSVLGKKSLSTNLPLVMANRATIADVLSGADSV
jgi:hypothetical protein